jgi:Fe-S oxidoreductase
MATVSTATTTKTTGHIVDPVQTTEDCRFCWMCRHICPVGHVTASETLTPHGWGLTIASVKRGTLTWDADSVDVLYKCADCGLCRTHCITDRPLPDAIAAARAELADAGLAPAIVYDIDEMLKRWGNPYGPPPPDASAAEAASASTPAGSGAATAAAGAASAGAVEEVAAREPRDGAPTGARGGVPRGGVALFVGDAAHHLDPRGLAAAQALLAAAGVTAVPIGVGRSSGLLASSLGLAGTAEVQARAVLDEVAASGCRQLLVLSAGDRYAFEKLYLERLNIAWPADVEIKEVTDVLAAALAQGRLTFTPRADAPAYAYHDPDHGPRIARDAAAPRALLAAALGETQARRMFWREQRAHPTGASGGLEFTQPALAARLTDARLEDAATAGAVWVIADDAADLRQLRTRVAASTAPVVEVYGLYELLHERLAR